MVRFLRNYSVASAVIVLIVVVTLAIFHRQLAVSEMIRTAESSNVALSRSFANNLWSRFGSLVEDMARASGEELRAHASMVELNRTMMVLTAGLPILKVKIYNIDGTTVYSSEVSQMGEDKSANTGFLSAARNGVPASKFSHRGKFSAFSGEVLNRDVVESYVPIRDGGGKVVAVFELYSDVTELMARIHKTTVYIVGVALLGFITLWGLLFVVVRHANQTQKEQYDKLVANETELGHAQDELKLQVRDQASKLQKSEALFRAVVNNSPTKIHIKDLEGRYTLINKQAEKLFGVTDEEGRGKTTHELFEKNLADAFTAHDHVIVESGEVMDKEEVFILEDGVHTYLTTKFPIFDQDGITGIGAIGTDITKRKKVEEALRESETLFKTFMDSNPAAIDFKTAEGRYVFVNKTWSRITGISAEEAVTCDGGAFYQPEHVRESARQHQEVVRTRKALTFERNFETPNGERYSRAVTKFPLYEDDNRLVGIGTIATDITERVQAEEDRRIALVEAEQANQAKSEFLATMSHELRTPLNAILGFSDILSQQYFGPPGAGKYKEYAEDIRTSGEHLLELVNQILDLSTIEAGKQSLSKENLATKEIVAECEKIIEDKARSNGIGLVTKIPKDLPPLYADRRAVMQILLNLLSNAVKFTPEGGKIMVSVKASKRNMTLKIADTGKGIPPDKLPELTNPFVRVNSNSYLAEQGWGLGLSITKSLVDLHGGDMEIKSIVGKGTTVTVTLPNAA